MLFYLISLVLGVHAVFSLTLICCCLSHIWQRTKRRFSKSHDPFPITFMVAGAADSLSRLTLDDRKCGRARSDTRGTIDTMYTTYSMGPGRTEEKYGRIFATPLYEAEYFLPVDEEEIDRLLIAHQLWDKVKELSMTDLPEGSRVLDLGAGPGFWVQHHSEVMPQVEFVGIDIYYGDFPDTPSQCYFEVDDCEQSFGNPLNPAALVHARDTYLWLQDPERLATHVYETLSPGGWFQNDEIRIAEWTCNKLKFGEWQRRLLGSAKELQISLHSIQQMDEAFARRGYRRRFNQTYRWRTDSNLEESSLELEFVRRTVRATARILIEGEQIAPEEAQEFLDQVDSELKEDDCWVQIVARVFWAQKSL